MKNKLMKRIINTKIGRIVYGTDTYIPSPFFKAESRDLKTLLITCGAGFDQDFPNASSLMRIGFARGWAKEYGSAKLIPANSIIQEIRQYDRPAVFMSEFEFADLTYNEARELRHVDLFVWVGIHPRKYREWERKVIANHSEIERSLNAYSKIMIAEPKFVWNAVGSASAEWYQGWRDDGLRWETIYPAVDTDRYYYDDSSNEYKNIQMAYVGGYWEEKAQGFDLYLRPWEDILTPFGYEKWPYKNYGGMLNKKQERLLYSNAGLIPLVTGPAGWLIAEITERYLKAPACRGFCIADHNPALREVFSADEMLQAESPEHFHELVRMYLNGEIDTEAWRERGYNAVMKRHTYAHRAMQIVHAIGS